MRRVIITGDDFGLTVPVNEGIEQAHREGVLTTASLMVGTEATQDAVRRAKRLPSLRVGLHVVVVDGSPVLPPPEVPYLVGREGRFSIDLFKAGVNFFFRPGIREQLEKEVRAQFQAFRDTGLPLDHVNTHHHMHLHPTVLGIILKVGEGYGMRAIRLPQEPFLSSRRTSRAPFLGKMTLRLFLSPWLRLLKSRLRHARVRSNQFIFGMHDSGHMTVDLLDRILKDLPEGVSEIYFHPAVRGFSGRGESGPDVTREKEFEVLVNPDIRRAFVELGIERIAFGDL